MAVDRAGPALLDPGIVDLEQLIEPCKKFRTRLAHGGCAIDGGVDRLL